MLIGKCTVHDVSKLVNTREFMALASIVDDTKELSNVKHHLSDEQKSAISLHWEKNSHHPEHYDNPNDMQDIDLLEMACDCHARSKQYKTDLLSYIDYQQQERFHFSDSVFKKLRYYCEILVNLTKDDDYGCIINSYFPLNFNLRDKTLDNLDSFEGACYVETIKTERLCLEKRENPDFASVSYELHLLQDYTKIGEITILCNGEVSYKIYQNYQGNGYEREVLRKLADITLLDELILRVNEDNILGITVAMEVGFTEERKEDNSLIFKLIKSN